LALPELVLVHLLDRESLAFKLSVRHHLK
jgi:hypothetical protein